MKNFFAEEHHIYVAGPMYGSGHVDENIKAALAIADIILESGFIPFVPHLFTFWHFRSDKPVEDWLRMDKAWLRKCDGMVRIDGESPGASLEEGWANEWEIPIHPLPSVEAIQNSMWSRVLPGGFSEEMREWLDALPK